MAINQLEENLEAITRTIEQLKKQNIWVYAADMDGQNYKDVDYANFLSKITKLSLECAWKRFFYNTWEIRRIL